MTDETWALEAIRLSKSFGTTAALREVDFRVDWGEKVALLGGNGAGKTTLLRLAAGLLRPSSGEIWLDGRSHRGDGVEARRLVGFVGHQGMLYPDLTVAENLGFHARMFGISNERERMAVVMARLDLARRRDERVRFLSRGNQQRAALARALLHDPPILLLDEPETGLDAAGRELLVEILDQPDRTVILSTHDLALARRVADRVVVLVGGRVADDLATSSLGSQAAGLGRVG